MKPVFSWRNCLILLLLMVLPLVCLLVLFPGSAELVRLRNAMVFDTISAEHSDWTPGTAPLSFRQETARTPAYLQQITEDIEGDTPLQRMLNAAAVLNSQPRLGNPIQSDTATTLQIIREQGVGYCADFTQVTNALAHALHIPVREWGMSFDGFGGYGHAFSEIWDGVLQQWIMLDLFNSFYPADPVTQTPLSALQFRERLLQNPHNILIVRVSPAHFGFRDDEALFTYFSRGLNQFYLWWGNNSISYDKIPEINIARQVSPHAEQLTAIMTGHFPLIKALAFDSNNQQIKSMLQLKMVMWSIFWLELALAFLLLCCIIGTLWRRKRQPAAA